jgi:hypothetical protein
MATSTERMRRLRRRRRFGMQFVTAEISEEAILAEARAPRAGQVLLVILPAGKRRAVVISSPAS